MRGDRRLSLRPVRTRPGVPLEGYRFKALVQQARRASQESAKMRSA